MDTLGQERQFTEQQLELAAKYGQMLKATLVRLDRQLFKEERVKRSTLVEMSETANPPSAEEQTKEMERLKQALERQGAPSTEEVTTITTTTSTLSLPPADSCSTPLFDWTIERNVDSA